jgi:hypothetical protein
MNALDDKVEDYDAWDILDELGKGLDLMTNATELKWCAYFTQEAFDLIKNDPDDYLYLGEDGESYVRVFDNQTIPFIIHMRFAGIDNSITESDPDSLGCRCEIDDA